MDSNLLINDAVGKAIDVCTCSEVKEDILRPPMIPKNRIVIYRKDYWDAVLESKARSVVIEKNYEPKETVMGHVHSIARRMLTWARYHESVIALSRKCTYDLLQPSVFTSLGLIDSKKIVEHLMTETEKLTTEQRYRLACLYCLKEHIQTLHQEMSLESRTVCYEMENPRKIRPLEMVIFWSRYLVGDVDSLRKNQSLSDYRLEKAVESANLAAVEFCLESGSSAYCGKDLMFAAKRAVKNKLIGASLTVDKKIPPPVHNLESKGLLHNLCDYYNDILYLLLSKMSSEDQRSFLRMDICGYFYGKNAIRGISNVLQCFLYWPYQTYFMQTVRKMWDFLPKKCFADILLSMCKQLESKKGDTHYGEDRAYDYRKLIKEFWCESDQRFKRYVFENVPGRKGLPPGKKGMPPTMKAKQLLVSLYFLRNITLLDRDNIKMILASASVAEKSQISQSKEGKSICCELITNGNWEVLNEFVDNMHQRKKAVDDFRRFFISSNDSILLFRRFLKSGLIESAQKLIEWAGLPKEEELRFKSDIITSDKGMMICIDLVISVAGIRHADRICRWCFASDEDISDFKQRLISSEYGMGICAALVTECKFDQVDCFVKWCLSEEVAIVEFKKRLAYEKRDSILVNLFTSTDAIVPVSENLDDDVWEKVERFLTWCFSNEEEISHFKRTKRLSASVREIHFYFIKSEQWAEADKFFLWLEMSADYVQQLKRLTLFNHVPCLSYLTELASEGEKEDIFNFLRWFLKEEETARSFQVIVEDFCKDNKCIDIFNGLDLLIEEYISEIKGKTKGTKRKSGIFSPNKKLRSPR